MNQIRFGGSVANATLSALVRSPEALFSCRRLYQPQLGWHLGRGRPAAVAGGRTGNRIGRRRRRRYACDVTNPHSSGPGVAGRRLREAETRVSIPEVHRSATWRAGRAILTPSPGRTSGIRCMSCIGHATDWRRRGRGTGPVIPSTMRSTLDRRVPGHPRHPRHPRHPQHAGRWISCTARRPSPHRRARSSIHQASRAYLGEPTRRQDASIPIGTYMTPKVSPRKHPIRPAVPNSNVLAPARADERRGPGSEPGPRCDRAETRVNSGRDSGRNPRPGSGPPNSRAVECRGRWNPVRIAGEIRGRQLGAIRGRQPGAIRGRSLPKSR